MTMAEAFRQVAESRPNQLAIVSGESRITFGDLLDRSLHLASGLHELGVHKGDRVAVRLSPGPDFASLFLAVAEIGAVIVPLNPQLRQRSLSNVLQDSAPLVLVSDVSLEAGSYDRPDSLKHVIQTRHEDATNPSLEDLISRGKSGSAPSTFPEPVSPEDLLALLYTSGTTGQPKGTMHSHRSLIAPVVATIKIRELWMRHPNLKSIGETAKALARYKTRLLRVVGRPQTFLSTVGWHSITGVELLLQGLLMGDVIVAMQHFHPRLAMELVEREKVTILVAIPTAFQAILSLDDFEKYDTSSLLICGTGAMPCPPDLGRRIQERFGCALHIGFGSTETAGGIAVPSIGDSGELQATTVGKPLPGMQVRIVDEQHRDLPIGQVGELLVQGESVMLGYFGRPKATSDVIDQNGWYASGDLAKLDENGYLHIVGRKKEMIIRSGQNIYPEEIESYLASHPAIQEAAVVGVPSVISGEEAWAFIILKPGFELSTQGVLDFCRAELEPFKIPSQVRFVADFPHTAIGKPQKYLLQSDVITELRKDKGHGS